MIKRSKISEALLVASTLVFILCIPIKTIALAGISEETFDFIYSKNIVLEYNAPSDACPRDERGHRSQTCFTLRSKLDRYDSYPLRLTEINIPESANVNQQYVFGKSYFDNSWLIYDLDNKKQVFSSQSFNEAVDKWLDLGQAYPKLANLHDVEKKFIETAESREKHGPYSTVEHQVFALVFLSFVITYAMLRRGSFVKRRIWHWMHMAIIMGVVVAGPNLYFVLLETLNNSTGINIFLAGLFALFSVPLLMLQVLIWGLVAPLLHVFPSTEYLFFYPEPLNLYFNLEGNILLLVIGFLLGLTIPPLFAVLRKFILFLALRFR